MSLFIYFFSVLTIIFTILSITQKNFMYSLFYFLVSTLTTSSIYFFLGDYFIGALQVIIYSGAIIVLFVFAMMMFNLNHPKQKKSPFIRSILYLLYSIPIFSFFIFLFIKIFFELSNQYIMIHTSGINMLGMMLFKPYVLIIEFISILLLSALITIMLISKIIKV